MRAAMAFAWTLQSGAGFINDGQLTVFEPTAIGQRILTPSLVSIMADATPPPELLSVVPNKLHMRVAQKVRIIRKASRMYGYGDLKPGVIRGNRQRGELLKRRYEHVIKHHLGLDPKAVFLMHRPTFDELGHLVPEGNAGYWGMDHRAHNRWAGKKTLVLLGNFYTPPHDMLQAWEAARAFALAGGASQEDWPVWDGSMAKTAWVREGAWEVRSWLPMPTNEKARQYFLLLARAEVIQAIGRLRAVRHDHQVDVYAYGGVPLLDMEAQGFTMAYEDESSDIGISPEDWNGTVHAATLSKAMRAAALMLDEGLPLESLSSRKLNHQLKSGQNLLDHAAFCRGMPSSTALDTYVAKIDGRGTSSKTSTEVVALVKSVAREKASTDPMLEESVTGEQYVRWPVIPGARCAPGHAGRE